MPSRISLVAILAATLPTILVLLAVLALARPASPAPTEATGSAPPNPPTPSTEVRPGSMSALARPSSSATADGMCATAEASSPTSSANMQPSSPPAQPRPSGPAAPELIGGGAWINSEPLTLASLRGRVVLIDFWTYGCYNCQNTLPYVKQWWSKYKDQGLVIVGVHTPEFAAEKVLANVQSAVAQADIGWPVVQDNDYKIWRAYGNNYWPRFYLVDDRGQIIYDHIGEGAYDETERQLQAALAAAKMP